MQPTKPGQLCIVVGGRMPYNNEGVSPNQGKKVITEYLHSELAGIEQEPVWHCKSTSSDLLFTYYGNGSHADFLECWLEVIEPDQLPQSTLTKEIENV